jgi:hypothetical protein
MERAGSIATFRIRGACRLGLVVLVSVAASGLGFVNVPVAQAATAHQKADPLSPLRVFIAVVPTTPAPLVTLHENERAHLDALTCERPVAAPASLDALRQAASSRTAPGGH